MTSDTPPEFYACVDRFIDLANTMVADHDVTRVSAVIMFAAARFNAHCAKHMDPNIHSQTDAAVQYFADQYSKMLRDSLDRLSALERQG